MDTKKIIREFMVDELKDNGFREEIRDDESLTDLEIMDSLGVLITINFLEEKFGIVIDANELDQDDFDSIDALASLIESKLQAEE
jgi:acyl carrier protein